MSLWHWDRRRAAWQRWLSAWFVPSAGQTFPVLCGEGSHTSVAISVRGKKRTDSGLHTLAILRLDSLPVFKNSQSTETGRDSTKRKRERDHTWEKQTTISTEHWVQYIKSEWNNSLLAADMNLILHYFWLSWNYFNTLSCLITTWWWLSSANTHHRYSSTVEYLAQGHHIYAEDSVYGLFSYLFPVNQIYWQWKKLGRVTGKIPETILLL